jgi:hypothetical protein
MADDGVPMPDTHHAHGTAIAMRVLDLRRRFPTAGITTRINDDENPADIVCWNCDPNEVWVWEFRHSSLAAGAVVPELPSIRSDPRAAGKAVVPGPNSVFFRERDACANMATRKETIGVRNGERDGLQIYERFRHEGLVANVLIQIQEDAIEAATDAELDAERYLAERGGVGSPRRPDAM